MNAVAVIGLGNIAIRHRQNIKKCYPQTQVWALSASGKKQTTAIENADRFIENVESLLELRPDFVIVASPATFHARHAIPLIKAGIPVLIEKPVSASIEEAQAILRCQQESNTPVAVGYCLRYLPLLRQLKILLDDNVIGDVFNINITVGQYLPDWRPNKPYTQSVSAQKVLGGGALLELSHELDYAQWLFGELALKFVNLHKSKTLNLDVEDIVDITFLDKNSSTCHVHLDFIQSPAQRYCNILGSNGRLDCNLITNKITYHYNDEIKLIYNEPNFDKNNIYIDMVTDFIKYIKEGHEHDLVLLPDAINTLTLIEEIQIAAAKKELTLC